MRRRCLALALLACSSSSANAQQNQYTQRQIAAVKTDKPPVIDGDISDEAWKSAPKAETFLDIQNGNSVADQTIAWILYDEKFIYIAFHCKDSQPTSISARETVRDYINNDSTRYPRMRGGLVRSVLHTSSGRAFPLFPERHRNSISSSRGRTRQQARVERRLGWRCQASIGRLDCRDAKSRGHGLSYPSSGKPATFAINFIRFQNRTRIQSIWSNITKQDFFEREGQWTGVMVPAGAFHPKLSLLPYILPGVQRSDATFRSGIDARYTITPELTAVGSVNPDFNTIEGAVETIHSADPSTSFRKLVRSFWKVLDYFSRTNVNIIGQIYYPRRIQTFDAGFKVYGKVSPTDTMGLLHTEDFGDRNDTIMRYRHDFGPTSTGGIFFTNMGSRFDNNTVGGCFKRFAGERLDWIGKPSGRVAWAETETRRNLHSSISTSTSFGLWAGPTSRLHSEMRKD
jgi:hypothetical protein